MNARLYSPVFRRLLPLITGGLALLVVSIATTHGAQAAPQMLAVAATDTIQPLHCNEGACAAEFSSFCLQKERSNPAPGTAYRPHGTESFTLVFHDSSGALHRMAANDLIRITANRGFTSVLAEIDESTLKQLDAIDAGLEVAGGATLIPKPLPGDPKPITSDEITKVVETLRPMADQWLGGMDEKARTVRIVNTLINQTPLVGSLSSADRAGLWNQVADYAGNDGSTARAKEMHDACLWRAEIGRYHSMRDCLGVKHDSLLQDMNLSYWKATGAGS